MIKIIESQNEKEERIVEMKEMKPLEVGIIVDNMAEYNGSYVMRTASRDKFEIMCLTDPQIDRCWTGETTLKVRLLAPGEKITIELFNE